MHERTNVNCLLHESSTHRRPWSSCHQDRSLLGLEIFNRPSAFATWVWWSRGLLVLFYGSACTWYKQSERFTSTRDQLCLQSFSVWQWICVAPDRVISDLRNFFLGKQPLKQPWSRILCCSVLPAAAVHRLIVILNELPHGSPILAETHLNPTWKLLCRWNQEETFTGNLSFLLIFEFFEFQCLNPDWRNLVSLAFLGIASTTLLGKFWEVMQRQMIWSGWQLYRNLQIFEESILGKPPTETVR